MVETLIFHVRDPKDLMQVAIEEDNASSVTTPAAMLGTNTPAGRIKLERFGKSSVGAGSLCWNRRGILRPTKAPTSRYLKPRPRL